MKHVRQLFTTVRTALRVAIARIDTRLRPPEPAEPLFEPEEAARLAREQHRRALRASRKPWYYSRQQPLRVPESLRYYEAVHGTKATVAMLKARAQHETERDE